MNKHTCYHEHMFMNLINEQHAMHTHAYIHIIVSYLPNISLVYNNKWLYILTFLNKITNNHWLTKTWILQYSLGATLQQKEGITVQYKSCSP